MDRNEFEADKNAKKTKKKVPWRPFLEWNPWWPWRPKWKRNFETDFLEALAKAGVTEEAFIGKYIDDAMTNPIIRDKVIDRLYGKATQPTDLTSDGKEIINLVFSPTVWSPTFYSPEKT
jgi:hypothetical protein